MTQENPCANCFGDSVEQGPDGEPIFCPRCHPTPPSAPEPKTCCGCGRLITPEDSFHENCVCPAKQGIVGVCKHTVIPRPTPEPAKEQLCPKCSAPVDSDGVCPMVPRPTPEPPARAVIGWDLGVGESFSVPAEPPAPTSGEPSEGDKLLRGWVYLDCITDEHNGGDLFTTLRSLIDSALSAARQREERPEDMRDPVDMKALECISALESELAAARQEIEARAQEGDRARAKILDLNAELRVARQREERLNKMLDNAQDDICERTAMMRGRISALESENAKLSDELKAERERADRLEAHMEARELLLAERAASAQEQMERLADLEDWRDRAFALCARRSWSMTPLNRLGAHTEETAELNAAVRGKEGDIVEEAGDAIFTLLAMIPKTVRFADVMRINREKVARLMDAPVGHNHEEREPAALASEPQKESPDAD